MKRPFEHLQSLLLIWQDMSVVLLCIHCMPLSQEGEFIDVFLLPYDGLYDALLVSRTSLPLSICCSS
jgi:hypothetical protein